MSVVKMLKAEVEEPSRPRLKIERYMAERGLTVQSIRKGAGLSAGFYSLYRGERKPHIKTVHKLADYFKIPEDDVLALFTPLEEAPPDFTHPVHRQFRTLPQEVASEPDAKLSVQLSTLDDGRVHLMLSLDRVMPLADALTLLRCLDGG